MQKRGSQLFSLLTILSPKIISTISKTKSIICSNNLKLDIQPAKHLLLSKVRVLEPYELDSKPDLLQLLHDGGLHEWLEPHVYGPGHAPFVQAREPCYLAHSYWSPVLHVSLLERSEYLDRVYFRIPVIALGHG